MLASLLSFGVGFTAGRNSRPNLGTLNQIATGPRHIWVVNTDNEIFSREVNGEASYGQWVKQPWYYKRAIAVTPEGHIWALGTNMDSFVYRREGVTHSNPMGTRWKLDGYSWTAEVAAGFPGVWTVQQFSRTTLSYQRHTYGDTGSSGSAWIAQDSPSKKSITQLFVGPRNVWVLNEEGSLFCLPVCGDNSFGLWQSYDSRLTSESTQKMKRIAISPTGNKWALWKRRVGRGADEDATGFKWILDNDQLNLIDISAGKVGVWATDNSSFYYRSGTYGDEYDITSLTGSWVDVK